MKKKLCVLSVLGAITVAPTVSADSSKVEIYGRLYPQIELRSESDATSATATFATLTTPGELGLGLEDNDSTHINAQSSRIGFRGEHDVGGGNKFIWQLEGNADFTERDGDIAGRDSFLGIKGRYGQVLLGALKTSFRGTGDPVGFLGVNAGNIVSASNVLSTPGFSGDSDASFHIRYRNGIQYQSPNVGGFFIKTDWATQEDTVSDIGSGNDPRLVSFAARYETGGLELRFGFEKHYDSFGASETTGQVAGTNSRDTGIRLAGAYEFGGTTVGLTFERLEYEEDNAPLLTGISDLERDAIRFVVEHKFSKKFRGAVMLQAAEEGDCTIPGAACLSDDLGAMQYAIGIRYDLTRNARLYAFATQLANDDSATYTVFDQDDRDQASAPGVDETAIVGGLYYRF